MKKIIIFIIVSFLLLVGCSKTTKNRSSDPSLLVSVSNYQFKIGATYDGMAIFEDGTVYAWYFSSTKSDYNNTIGSYSLYTKNGFTSFVMDKWMKKNKIVSKKDLNKIKNYIHNLKQVDINCQNEDKDYSDLTIYMDNDALSFPTSGNCDMTATNKNVERLMSILKDYR